MSDPLFYEPANRAIYANRAHNSPFVSDASANLLQPGNFIQRDESAETRF